MLFNRSTTGSVVPDDESPGGATDAVPRIAVISSSQVATTVQPPNPLSMFSETVFLRKDSRFWKVGSQDAGMLPSSRTPCCCAPCRFNVHKTDSSARNLLQSLILSRTGGNRLLEFDFLESTFRKYNLAIDYGRGVACNSRAPRESSLSNGPPGWQIVLIFVWVVYTVWLLREGRGRQAPGQKLPSNILVESCVRLHALPARSPDLTVLVLFRLLLGRTYR